MFKLISLGCLAFSPVAVVSQQAFNNQSQNRSYPKIFDDVFELFFTASDSFFDNGDTSNHKNNYFDRYKNQEAFQDFKRSPIYRSWKKSFGNFLNNLNKHYRYNLASILSATKQDKGVWQKPKFEDYAKVIDIAISELPEGPNKNEILNERDSLPFIRKLLSNKGIKVDFYKKMLERIFDREFNSIPSNLMRKNLWDLKMKVNSFLKNKHWQDSRTRIEIKDFFKKIQDNKYGTKHLKRMFGEYFPWENKISKNQIDQFLSHLKYQDKGKYKELLEKFEDILDKNIDIGKIDIDNIVKDLDPELIESIVKNPEIFEKLGSHVPTMNSIQKWLTIAGGFGTLLISFFTAALALKLILVKSSKRAIALSSTGTIALFGTGAALIILAFI